MKRERLDALRKCMEENRLDGLVVTKYVNLHYFSGFRGDDTTLVVTKDHALLITDSRYVEQAEAEAPLFCVVEQKEGLLKKTAEEITKLGCQNVGFEGNALRYDDYRMLAKHLSGIRFDTSIHLDELRQVKDEEELALIRKACAIADAAYRDIITFIRPGMTELAVAARLERIMREEGAEKTSFDTIVASGLRGSMPHGTATDKIIERGDFVTMDYGAKYKGYCSDMTRTICVGKASERQKQVYDVVLHAQEAALAAIAPGKSGKEIDAVARRCLEAHDLAQYFGHGLGHSLGLEIHEEPRLSRFSKCEHLLPGMLVTDEPGVYIPSWGGLRIEDTVLVTKKGNERLTKSSKAFVEINLESQ